MEIQSLAVQLPTRRVSNADLLDLVHSANAHAVRCDLEGYKRRVGWLLARSGARIRFYRDVAAGETAISLIARAVDRALADAGLARADVDLLIYCGVGRGFVEPSSAAFVLNALKMSCDGFDILDACMSWVRALHISQSLIETGCYSRILVVNGEFNVFELGLSDIVRIENAAHLSYSFPAFTIGEAATATVLSGLGSPWQFTFKSRPDLAPLCSVPAEGYREYCSDASRIGMTGINRLVAYGGEMADAGMLEVGRLLREAVKEIWTVDWFIPHVPSSRVCEELGRHMDIMDRVVVDSFSAYGNTISASIPVAMWQLLQSRKLHRGNRVVLCPASAGMSFGVVDFRF